MALDNEGWLPEAKRLRVGTKRRVPHDCGDGTVMIVSHEPDKYTAWCFRCSEGGFVRKEPTLADMVELRRRAQEDAALRTATLPLPMTANPREWPREARLWLYRAGIHDTIIKRLGIYYHKPSQRVVLPVVEDGKVTYWQARAVMPGQKPKYLNPEVDRDSVLPRFGGGPVIVLTEDYLSAAKVGRVVEGWSLLGTSLKDPVLARAVRDGRPVLVWLDPDEAGRSAAARITRELRAVGVQTENVVSAKDPKLLCLQEIRKCLSSWL